MTDAARPTPQADLAPVRRTWSLPLLRELPKLTDLTLASAIGGSGGTGGGGSTVFGLLLAVLSLAVLPSCSTDRMTGTSEVTPPPSVATIACDVQVAAKTISCGGPQKAGGQEIIGGQGTRVALRSRNVTYTPVDSNFHFDVSLQNLSNQSLGYDGNTITGIYLFFTTEPVATAGTGLITITSDGEGTFTAGGQDFFLYNDWVFPGQGSSERTWEFKVPEDVDAFEFTVLVAAGVEDQGGILRWDPVEGMANGLFNAVARLNDNDMMAVAGGGRSYRWDGSTWQSLTPTGGEEMIAVAVAGTEYAAVGNGGGIFRSKGNIWTQIFAHPSAGMYDVWAQGPDTITAVGGHFIVTCIGGNCTDDDIGVLATGLGWVDGTPDGGLRVAMSYEGEFFKSLNGGPWFADGALFPPGDFVPTGMIIDPDGTVIVSLFSTTAPYTAIVTEGGDTLYSAESAAVQALVSVNNDLLYALVDDWGLGGREIQLVNYAGAPAHFSLTGGQVTPFGHELVCANAGCDQIIITAQGYTPTVRWDAGAFRSEQAAPYGGPIDLALAGNTVLEVAGGSDIWEITGTTATAVPSGLTGLKAIATVGTGADYQRVVVDGTNTLMRWNGSAWDVMTQLLGGEPINDVWGELADQRWVMVGGNGEIAEFNNTDGFTHYFTGESDALTRLWGCGPTVWMGSTSGKLFRLEGGVVTEEAGVLLNGGLGAIGGSSCSDVWAVGIGGEVFHFDGSGWSDTGYFLGNPFFPSIWVRDPGQAYIGGVGGSLYLIDLAAPSIIPMHVTMGADHAVAAMVGTPSGTLFAAGGGYVARGTP